MRVIVAVTFLCLMAVPSLGGSAENPDLVDPAGDQAGYNPSNASCSPGAGSTVYDPEDFQDVDLLTVWWQETLESDTVTVGLTTSAAIDEGDYIIDFTVTAGPDTVPGSQATPEGTEYTLRHNNGDYSGVEGGSATASGSQLLFSFPKTGVGAAGGEVVSQFRATAQRTTMDVVPLLCADNWGFRDLAGPSEDILFSRLPAVPGANLTAHSVHLDGLPQTSGDVVVPDGNGTLEWVLNLTNEGDMQDNFTLAVQNAEAQAALGIDIQLGATSVMLAPGETRSFNLTITVSSAGPGQHGALVSATSSQDANVTALYTAFFTVPGGVDAPTDGETTGGANATTQDTGDQESPGLPVVGMAVVLAMAALLRRRI